MFVTPPYALLAKYIHTNKPAEMMDSASEIALNSLAHKKTRHATMPGLFAPESA